MRGLSAELLYAGKEGGGESVSQAENERLLIEHGRDPRKAVVRLRGGDPSPFGRGGEEVEGAVRSWDRRRGRRRRNRRGRCARQPAGIPVTHRGSLPPWRSSRRRGPGESPVRAGGDALAVFPGPLVVYMGVRQLEVDRRAADLGWRRDPEEPAALIERGTLPDQRVLTGTLARVSTLGPGPRDRGVRKRRRAPGRSRLAGLTVAVTRARRRRAARVAAALARRGVEIPAIRIEPLVGPAPDLMLTAGVPTSPNGVRVLFDRLRSEGKDARAFAGVTVAAIGPGTAALRDRITADVVPERHSRRLLDAGWLAGQAGCSWRERPRRGTCSDTRVNGAPRSMLCRCTRRWPNRSRPSNSRALGRADYVVLHLVLDRHQAVRAAATRG